MAEIGLTPRSYDHPDAPLTPRRCCRLSWSGPGAAGRERTIPVRHPSPANLPGCPAPAGAAEDKAPGEVLANP